MMVEYDQIMRLWHGKFCKYQLSCMWITCLDIVITVVHLLLVLVFQSWLGLLVLQLLTGVQECTGHCNSFVLYRWVRCVYHRVFRKCYACAVYWWDCWGSHRLWLSRYDADTFVFTAGRWCARAGMAPSLPLCRATVDTFSVLALVRCTNLDRSYSMARRRLWNSLPTLVRSAESHDI